MGQPPKRRWKTDDGGTAGKCPRATYRTRRGPEKNEKVADDGKDIAEIVLSPPEEIFSFDFRGLVLRLTQNLVCCVFIALSQMIVVHFAFDGWRTKIKDVEALFEGF